MSFDSAFAHLFLRNFSKSNFADCCGGKAVDPFLVTQETSYTFDTSYYRSLDELEKIIINKRKKVETISKVWVSGQKEDITVFATPISGKFCSSNLHPLGQQRSGYKGRVYIPYSSFAYSDEFWRLPSATLVLNHDFSKISFDVLQY
jgi:hypothetical protein